jgi:hypothetical protein
VAGLLPRLVQRGFVDSAPDPILFTLRHEASRIHEFNRSSCPFRLGGTHQMGR